MLVTKKKLYKTIGMYNRLLFIFDKVEQLVLDALDEDASLQSLEVAYTDLIIQRTKLLNFEVKGDPNLFISREIDYIAKIRQILDARIKERSMGRAKEIREVISEVETFEEKVKLLIEKGYVISKAQGKRVVTLVEGTKEKEESESK